MTTTPTLGNLALTALGYCWNCGEAQRLNAQPDDWRWCPKCGRRTRIEVTEQIPIADEIVGKPAFFGIHRFVDAAGNTVEHEGDEPFAAPVGARYVEVVWQA